MVTRVLYFETHTPVVENLRSRRVPSLIREGMTQDPKNLVDELGEKADFKMDPCQNNSPIPL